MKNSTFPGNSLRFGTYEFDLRSGELRKHGIRIKLQEQPCQILAILLEHHGEMVTREELQRRLWPSDTFVDFDHSLNTAVMRLREALSDSSESPRFIETIPRRGYRFIAPLQEVSSASSASTDSAEGPTGNASVVPLLSKSGKLKGVSVEKTKRSRWLVLPRLAFFLITIAVIAAVSSQIAVHYARSVDSSKPKSDRSTSLVVLPLENLSGDKDQDYFADGMTDDLIANLAKIRSLRVISRSTAMAYKGTRKPLSQIARELNVDAVVEGTVLRAGDRVRITAELVQVATDHHLWAETYESTLGDVLALQNHVSSAIVDEIRINLRAEDKERLAKSPAVRPEAYESYLKGRYYWNKRSDEGFNKAIAYFQEATRKDPQYALAYAGLADCYAVIGATIIGTVSSAEAAPKAKAAAIRALEIDPSLAEAQTSLATAEFNYDWDWSGAASGFKKAIELNPSYATAYQRYSLYSAAMGRFPDSLDQINKARELDPLSISINWSLGWRLYLARQYDRAIEQLLNTADMDPSYELPHLVLGQAYEQKRDFAHSIPQLQKAAELSHGSPLMVSGLAHGYAVAGNRTEAEKLLHKLLADSSKHYVSPYYIAIVYTGIGETEKAMDWLERAYADRSNGLVFLKVDPQLDSLRTNPRFKALQARLKLPD
jgi:TolB-like protein/DNA-binding winged helix-turn-helix (wHTH) protein/Tfp pilus assembly protein PilF